MSVSLQHRLNEVAKEFEDQKYRQLDLYQRQLRKAREQLQERDDDLAACRAELEDVRALAEDAEMQRSADSRNVVELTREVIALKFELAAAIEAAANNAKVARPASAEDPVFEEPEMPTDVMSFDSFRNSVAQGREDIVRMVLSPECRRAANVYKTQMGQAMVESWSLRDGIELSQLLMSAGASVTAEGPGGRTPLHAAAAAGNNQLVQVLVQHEGVDKDAVDSQARTALHLAARSKRARVVQTLLQLGANADLETVDGKTARDLAVDPLIGTGDTHMLARVFDSTETQFWNHSARAVAMHRADDLEPAMVQYTLAIDLAAKLHNTLSTDDKARLFLNRARVAQRLGKHTQTMADCEAALALDAPSSHKKALAVHAESAMALLDFERAVDDLKVVVGTGGEHVDRWAEMLREAKTLSTATHYETLNVESHASASDIKKAFRRESITWHPDKHAGDEDAQYRATLKFKRINEAHQTLSDPSQRTSYDRKVRYGIGSDDCGYGTYTRAAEKLWRAEVIARQREVEEELANSKSYRQKVQRQEEDARRQLAEEEAKLAAEQKRAQAAQETIAAEDRRQRHLETEMNRVRRIISQLYLSF